MRKSGLALAAVLAMATASFAAPVSITNSSFETATGYGGTWGGEPTGWNRAQTLGNADAATVLQVVNDSTFAGKDGTNYLYINTDGGWQSDGIAGTGTTTNSIWTDSLGTYAAGTKYTLTVALASASNSANRSVTLALDADAAVAQSTVIPFSSLSNSAFQDYTVIVDTSLSPSLVGKNISVAITHTVTNEMYGKTVAVDNVRLDATAVPEPATLGVLALSSLMVLRRRR